MMTTHIHILGICGTFMGSLAALAKEQGLRVTGCDESVYPPMSTQLETLGIELIRGFDKDQLKLAPDLFVIGNAISRGNPLLEEILDKGLRYTSGPQFLAEHILPGKWVLAVSGTHGKTTTTTMLAWILECAGMSPGFLIGGVPNDFDLSARLGDTPFFVIEADEYDSAFFDKRSKFVHYRPRTLVINNLEFDHADIFDDLGAIQTQFHHVTRTVPRIGQVIYQAATPAIDEVLSMGLWSESQGFGKGSSAENRYALLSDDGRRFSLHVDGENENIAWHMTGEHNVANALAAALAARHAGVSLAQSAYALARFGGIKRRMECLIDTQMATLYDDFAHHPSAIETTLKGLRAHVGDALILALIEPRSNTMRSGIHKASLAPSAGNADQVIWADFSPTRELAWLTPMLASEPKQTVLDSKEAIQQAVSNFLEQNRGLKVHILMMSNGSFAGMRESLSNMIKHNE
jgi:UDP-N-acetylmuramate: L-alanyl-gamma-D-glutamyl-meso-diaminopimelate ligase